ncbi:hypothetical protein ACWGB8_35470 [Kitasatospora sp. NPDC054939]
MPTIAVLVPLRGVRVAQRAQGAGGRDAVAAEQIQVAVLERGALLLRTFGDWNPSANLMAGRPSACKTRGTVNWD